MTSGFRLDLKVSESSRATAMATNARVLELVVEVLNSDLAPEQVCAGEPELLEEVKNCLKRCSNLASLINDVFPSTSDAACSASPDESRLPNTPGYEVLGILGRG